MTEDAYIYVIALGIIQGVAEFLPISSSGHIVIANSLLETCVGFRLPTSGFAMNVALHAGTLLSIVFVYFRDLVGVFHKPRLLAAIVLASVPVAVAGIALADVIETIYEEPLYAGCALVVTSVMLYFGCRCDSGQGSLEALTWWRVWTIGLFQAAAVVPGISRSGSTITAGLTVGLNRDDAARFSFLIAVPAIGGAVIFSLTRAFTESDAMALVTHAGLLAVGAITSFVVGWFSLRWLLRIISRGRLHWFSWYCAIAGIATVIWRLATR